MKKLYLLILFIISQNIYSQVPEPVSEQDRPIILYHAQVHIGNGTIIENGYICFDSGQYDSYFNGIFTWELLAKQ